MSEYKLIRNPNTHTVSFSGPYSAEFQNRLKKAVGRARFDYGRKCWTIPEADEGELLNLVYSVYRWKDTDPEENVSLNIHFKQRLSIAGDAFILFNETITASNLGTLNLEEKSVYLKSDENEKSRKKKKGEEGTAGKTSSLMMLSYSEIDNIADAIAEKEDSLTLREVREIMTQLPADDIALFGRMFASEKSYTQDAAAQVAFGFSTHEANIQYDYYTAVDDLSAMLGNKAGAAYLDNRPLSTCTMYRYANVNLDALSESLANEQKAIKIAAEFIKAFALTLPNGYQNSCAHHTMPSLIYLTVRTDQPINLMPAFEEPVESDHGYQKASGERLLSYAADLYDNFGNKPAWSVLIGAQNEIAPSKSLPEAIEMMKAEAKSLEKEAHA